VVNSTITFLYSDNMDVRRVHLNHRHQEPLTPALYGDYMSGVARFLWALSACLILRFLLFDRAAGFLPPRP
jgi:hypothetical protein